MDYTFKKLSSSDLLLLKELLKIFGDAFNEQNVYQRNLPSDDYLTALLAKPHFIVLVAMKENEVVGGLAAYVLEKFEQDRREIYIYDLAVAEQHRRKGVATKLINQLQGLAKEQRAYVIFVQADKGDAPAIQLYESFGNREEVLHFDIPVE
ncbi:MAG TPA: AAC(3)-I family aminoglycoside N-acetyltransferase [Verrucomicrobiae bacterium]|nr:AAC(3)-I family aminoglycoside N-acetyltransferase [Verrucomicrobiae bacterium]